MGFLQWFSYRSPRQARRDACRYDAWAFPYGEAQQRCIRQLLAQLVPQQPAQIAMARYLVAREGLLGAWDDPDYAQQVPEEERFIAAAKRLRGQLYHKINTELGLYLALAEVDVAIGPELRYPGADQLRTRGAELTDWLLAHKQDLS